MQAEFYFTLCYSRLLYSPNSYFDFLYKTYLNLGSRTSSSSLLFTYLLPNNLNFLYLQRH